MRFESLFQTLSIGNVVIKNRIAMAPMGVVGLVELDGNFSQRAIDYYMERAAGGVGLIISGLTRASEIGEPTFRRPFIKRETLSSFSELAESVHYYGAKIFVQLTAGYGRVIYGALIDGGIKPISASSLPAYWRPENTTRALEREEVEGIVKAIGEAGKLLKLAGIDGVELHGHEGYLLDQFTTGIWNKRTDKYGGSLEERLKFPVEVLNAIKSEAGSDFPVIYRYGLKHYIKGEWSGALPHEDYIEAGRDVQEGLEMAKLLEKAGFDGLHVDAGCYDSWYWPHPPNYQAYGCMVDMAAEVKQCVRIPVIAVGRLDIPEVAEDVIKKGKADIVALGRALLADPLWPRKVHRGDVEEIRPCLACHECLYRVIHEHKPLCCAVNPALGRERSYSLKRAESFERVLIAGGGIAGMEAARVSALRGHRVTLYEKAEQLGGHLIAASVPYFKKDISRLLNWYHDQLRKVGVTIKVNTEATAELILEEKPDRVIIATGSIPIIPNVAGIEKKAVATCIDLLLGRKEAGSTVVVIGGGLVGCETALWLADRGKQVTIVESLPNLASGMFDANSVMLLDMLRYRKVELLTKTSLSEVTDKGIEVIGQDLGRRYIPCDTVALGVGLRSETKIYDFLKKEMTDIHIIGDSKEPRKIKDAIWDGFHIGAR